MLKRLFLIALLFSSLSCTFEFARAQEVPAAQVQLPESDDGLPGVGPVRRYDWFKNLWNSRRGDWAKQVDKDQGAVVFLGDSITQGWGNDFKGLFPGLKLANRGISGDTTRGMLYRLQDDVVKLKPRAVVMLMGTNDLEENGTPEQVSENIKSILAELKKFDAAMPIVLCKVFPSSESKKRPAAKIQQINDLLTKLVADNSQVTLLDTYTLFADSKGDAKPEEFPDLLHPNDAGYRKWAQALQPVFDKLGLVALLKPTASLDSWNFEQHFDGQGEAKLDGESIVFTTTKRGGENWHVQTYQVGLDLQDGATYELQFTASSPEGRYVIVTGGINEDDWHGIGLFEEVYVGKQPEKFKFTFTANDTRPKNNRLGFVLGDYLGSVAVSNMTLKKVP